MEKKKILFVCTQNVFRSYSAHLLFEKYLKDNSIDGIIIDSAGTHAYSWERPYSYTFEKLEELGILCNYNHKNKKITKEIAITNDIIICMTKEHKEFVERNFGSKAYLFNEIALGKKTDLSDDNETIYDNLEDFVKSTIQYIHDNIENIYKNLPHLQKEL